MLVFLEKSLRILNLVVVMKYVSSPGGLESRQRGRTYSSVGFGHLRLSRRSGARRGELGVNYWGSLYLHVNFDQFSPHHTLMPFIYRLRMRPTSSE